MTVKTVCARIVYPRLVARRLQGLGDAPRGVRAARRSYYAARFAFPCSFEGLRSGLRAFDILSSALLHRPPHPAARPAPAAGAAGCFPVQIKSPEVRRAVRRATFLLRNARGGKRSNGACPLPRGACARDSEKSCRRTPRRTADRSEAGSEGAGPPAERPQETATRLLGVFWSHQQ